MDTPYVAMARDWLATFKKIMVDNKDIGIHPAAMLVPRIGTPFLCMLEFHNKEEETVLLRNLAATVKQAECKAVILFGAANTYLIGRQIESKFIFASIHQPGEAVFTIGQEFAVVNNEPVFGREIDSSNTGIIPWQVPPFWDEKPYDISKAN